MVATEAVDLAVETIAAASQNGLHWSETSSLQKAAEVLTVEAYVRGSKDNIGVTIVALDET